ncbi:MAG TPA: hypothetical protein VM093_04885 [Aeromicrobium sp.]|nr:hypothetical protein [Aeromicrobium sp.]
MNDTHDEGLSPEELAAEGVTALPDKEVVSILDLNADIDLAIDAAAPIDLAAAANLNVAAPIDAAVGANVLSMDSAAQALADQGVMVTQDLDADAAASATQVSGLDQGNDVIDGGTGAVDPGAVDAGSTPATTEPVTTGDVSSGALSGDLLNVDVNVDADADVAAPINGAVAANANVAAPIDAAVAANVGSVNSDAVAVADQDAIIEQHLSGSADASSDQSSDITQ